MLDNFTRVVTESVNIVNDVFLVTFIVLGNLVLITYVAWIVYLIRDMVKSKRYRRFEGGIKSEEEILLTNLNIKGNKGKFLLSIMIFEVFGIIFYQLSLLFGYLMAHFHQLRFSGIDLNTTCSSEPGFKPLWVSEFQFPEVSLFLCLGRVSLLITIALANSFIQFVSNTYVTQSWRYKRIMKGVWVILPFGFLIIFFGTIPQTTLVAWTLNITCFMILFCLFLRNSAFLTKALNWRKQDLQYYNESVSLKKHARITRNFKAFQKLHIAGATLLGLQDLLAQIEIIVTLFLYYGQCLFPVLYGISYSAPIQHGDLERFRLGLLAADLTQRVLLMAAYGFFILPQLFVTALLPFYYFYRAVMGRDSHNVRFHVIREPLLSGHE